MDYLEGSEFTNLPQYQETNSLWVENLALEEINMDESGVINFSEHLTPQKLLEESSINFMEKLRERIEIYVAKFNEYRSRGDQAPLIKVFKISNTVNDFMVYRNSLKLVVARRSSDLISIGFLSNTGGVFAARLNFETESKEKMHFIKASVGPFNRITWNFQNEPLDMEALVRHYLTEFVRHSAR